MDPKLLEAISKRLEAIPDQVAAANKAAADATAAAADAQAQITAQSKTIDELKATVDKAAQSRSMPRIPATPAERRKHWRPVPMPDLREANDLRAAENRGFSFVGAVDAIGRISRGQLRRDCSPEESWEGHCMHRAWQYKTANQVVGDDVRGGFFVPDEVLPDIIPAIYGDSVFLALGRSGQTTVRVIENLKGGEVSVPRFDGGTRAYWNAEEVPATKSTATTGRMTLRPHKLNVLTGMSEEMEKFGSFGFDQLLRDDMVQAAAEEIDRAIAFGDGGSYEPKGIARQNVKFYDCDTDEVLTQAEVAAHDWQTGKLDFVKLRKMRMLMRKDKVKLPGDAPIISSWDYLHWLAHLRTQQYSAQTEGLGMLFPFPITDEQVARFVGSTLLGTHLIDADHLPGATVGGTHTPTSPMSTNCTTVFNGDMRQVVFARWYGVEIKSDLGYGNFRSGVTEIKLIMWCDVGVRQGRAIMVCPNAGLSEVLA